MIHTTYKGFVTTYIIKKRNINFLYEATNDYLNGKYIFQWARSVGLTCAQNKAYFLDIFLGMDTNCCSYEVYHERTAKRSTINRGSYHSQGAHERAMWL